MRLGGFAKAGTLITAAALMLGATAASGAMQRQRILPSPPGAAGDEFGTSVAISGTNAIVGAPSTDAANNGLHRGKGAAYTFTRVGLNWSQQARISPADTAVGDAFGFSVAISGDIAVIGAYLDDDKGPDSGSAYVFTRLGSLWNQQAKIVPSDGATLDWFGYSVGISGTSIVIGARGDDSSPTKLDTGSTYVYTRSGSVWNQQAKLVASDSGAGDAFGQAVAIAGDTVIAGAPLDNIDPTPASDKGSAYVFTRAGTSWSQQAKLNPADGAKDDLFGSSVAVAGDTALIGAKFDDRDAAKTNAGSVYAYTRSGSAWTMQSKLEASDGNKDDWFGFSLALVGDTAIIGAPQNKAVDVNSGATYVFTRLGMTWTQQSKVIPAAQDAAKGDKFGGAVALSTDIALAGALFDDDAGLVNRGSAFVFEYVGCSATEQTVLAALAPIDPSTTRLIAEQLCALHVLPA